MPEASNRFLYLYRRWLKTKKVVKAPDDVEKKFIEYSDHGRMSRAKLHEFLVEHQKVEKDNADDLAQTIINKTNLNAGFKHCRRRGLSLNGFFQYLLSSQNPPLLKEDFKGDEKLAHYYVYTSHRSYLKREEVSQHHKGLVEKGFKITKKRTSDEDKHKITYSSIHAIEKALANGVRVLELDLCQNPDKSDLYVHHPSNTPRQSHSPVTLKHCFEVINERAFHKSQFPLIIILVEHLDSGVSADLQRMIKERMVKAFDNEKLCTPDTAFHGTLNSLKEKIIILTRHQTQGGSKPTDKHLKQQDKAKEEYADGYIEELKGEISDVPSSSPDKLRILSLTENRIESYKSSDIISFTQDNLLVVYPDFNSKDPDFPSNYDPLISWTRGAQMVAFNIQDYESEDEKYLWIMQGLFRAQGGKKPTGYVKKPKFLLDPAHKFDPAAWRPVKKILKVKVYMGTGWHLDFDSEDFDATSQPDFFTAVEIVGVPADEAREKTEPAMDQPVPVWNQEFKFPLTVPELAMLVIEVRDFDTDRTHDFGGQTCLPVCQLRTGIRSVPLYDKKGKAYRAARLLVRFQLD